MDAIILAAGLGTRLRPLTNNCPKALVKIGNTTLLEQAINQLTKLEARRIVVNVHHLGEQIIHIVESHIWDTEIVISDERHMLLDTGGALKKAIPLCHQDAPIMAYNVDIVSMIDLQAMVDCHIKSHNLVTLATSHRTTARQLLFDNNMQLRGHKNSTTGEITIASPTNSPLNELAFSGISIVEPQLASLLPEALRPYPIIPQYLELSKHHAIKAFIHKADQWMDVGKPDSLQKASAIVLQQL